MLIELNARTVSCNQMAIDAGVDFPWIGYCNLADLPAPHEMQRGQSSIWYMHEEWDFKAFLELRSAGEMSALQWIRDLRTADSTAIWASDDKKPALEVCKRFIRAGIRKIAYRPWRRIYQRWSR